MKKINNQKMKKNKVGLLLGLSLTTGFLFPNIVQAQIQYTGSNNINGDNKIQLPNNTVVASPLEQNINIPTTGNTPIVNTPQTTMVPQNANVQNSQQINAANPLGVPLNQQASQQTVSPMNSNVVQSTPMPLPSSQPPMGMPIDNSVSYSSPNEGLPMPSSGQANGVDATINILNTPNKRIRELNKDLYNKSRVINEGPVAAPKATNGLIVASVSPGSTSPVIRLYKNRTSTLLITDMSGQPWPIVNYDGLSEEDFSVKRLDNPSPNGYVLSITPKGTFVSGNLVVILKGLPTPLNIEFVSGQKVVDVSTEIRVQAKGPNSVMNTVGMPQSLDTTLLSILQGVPPTGAKQLRVSTPSVQAWLSKDGAMYVRTRHKIMSPAFEHMTSSPDGTYAYKMVPVPVVLYKVPDGRFGEFSVEGY